jgi:hypothetical protein
MRSVSGTTILVTYNGRDEGISDYFILEWIQQKSWEKKTELVRMNSKYLLKSSIYSTMWVRIRSLLP